MFAFEHYGIVPDVMLIAKAMGGGMPPGAAGKMDPEMQKMIQEMMRQQGR